jgi:hypothetical protein
MVTMMTAHIVSANLPDRQDKVGHGNADGGLDLESNDIVTAGEVCKSNKRCHLARGVKEEILIVGG